MVDAALVTHIGCVREVNEDSGLIIRENEDWIAALIADGMGGHKAGDIASQMAADAVKRVISGDMTDLSLEAGKELVRKAIATANKEVFQYAQDHPDCQGMGTTVALVLLTTKWGVVAHIGDSRVYCLEEDLKLLTQDHSLVFELLKKGEISEEEANDHPQKNVLIRALGTEADVQIDVNAFQWKEGDQLLLCSDGLSNKVSEEQICSVLLEEETAQVKCERLVQHALEAGGEDNISVIVIDHNGENHAGKAR